MIEYSKPLDGDELVQAYLQTNEGPFDDIELHRKIYDAVQELIAGGLTSKIMFRLYVGAEKGEKVSDRPYSNNVAGALWTLVNRGVVSTKYDGLFEAVPEAIREFSPRRVVTEVLRAQAADFNFEEII